MSATRSQGPRWPARLKDLCLALGSARDGPEREDARGEIWLLLNSSILQYLQFHTARLGKASREDREDIAAQKALGLMSRLEEGLWDVSDRTPSEITGFLSKVARNGLVDLLRETGRRVEPKEDDRPEWDVGGSSQESTVNRADSPDIQVERKEFASELRRCAEQLSPRSRLVWFFRVFLEMSTKEIAAHPEVGLKTGHVDVLMQRARDAIRDCMHRKGYEPHDMPPGTFVELWRAFRLEGTWGCEARECATGMW